MDSKKFLEEMLKVGYRDGDKPTSKTIAKVKFELGYSGFCKGNSMVSLFRPYQEPGKSPEVKAAVKAHIKSLGGQSEAYLGVKYEVPAGNVISFDAQYDKLHFVRAEDEEADFKEILDAISELEIPISEWVWIAYKSIDSPTAVAKGEDGKFETQDGERKYRKIIVPVEKYANEQAARAAAGNGGSAATDNSQWSSTALNGEFPDGISESMQDEIYYWYQQMMEGKAYASNPDEWPLPYNVDDKRLPEAAKQLAVKKFLSKEYKTETADIDVVLSLKVPF